MDIPGIFHSANVKAAEGSFWGLKEYIMCTILRKENSNASLCRKCGKCETHCPQGIPIREKLEEIRKDMEGPVFKIALWATKKFKLWK